MNEGERLTCYRLNMLRFASGPSPQRFDNFHIVKDLRRNFGHRSGSQLAYSGEHYSIATAGVRFGVLPKSIR